MKTLTRSVLGLLLAAALAASWNAGRRLLAMETARRQPDIAGLEASGGGPDTEVDATPPPITLTLEDLLEAGPFAVGVTTRTYVDVERATSPNGTYEGAPERTLEVEIWYPVDRAEVDGDKAVRDATPAPASDWLCASRMRGSSNLQSTS